MENKKIIAVTGATGAQGGGLVRAILQDPKGEFAVRALTRNPDSDKARELASQGAEVVEANIDDPESLRKALEGAYGAFFVTFFWDHFSPEKEMQQVRNMAQAAKDAGLQHVIWSTLEDSRDFYPNQDERMPTLHGQYKVPHFDGKGASDAAFAEAGVPTTYLLTSFYWENLIYFGMGPQKGPDGTLTLTFPMGDKPLTAIAAEDIGKCAYGIFKKGKELIGQRVGIAGDQRTLQEMADTLGKALGQEVRYQEVSPEAYRSFGFPGADDLGNMFQFYQEYSDHFSQTRDLATARELNPDLKDFEQWVAENKDRIPVS